MSPNSTFFHRNGGGRITGPDGGGFVGSDCYLSPDSEVRGDKSVISHLTTVLNKSVLDNCTAVGSGIDHVIALRSHIHHAQVAYSLLTDVVIRGANERPADLHNVSLSDDVVVEGCRLRNFELSGPHLLHVDWDRAPRHRLLETSAGVYLALTECIDDYFHVGCECRPFAKWDVKEALLRRYFVERNYGWSLEVFNSIRTTFEAWRRNIGFESRQLSSNARYIA
jgi:hypothetical protein